ncbi:CMGC protein kinase [Fusarium austroafricanum]|uniref:EKC/KEOPS complex subunit BUD32 n=1 Tax=Fusarium austroafricanum TaxID=2364996 RepID=A0A8H4KVC7_9HYPO|nr:CMGC protein kinase [Fusarium austroafricanum]
MSTPLNNDDVVDRGDFMDTDNAYEVEELSEPLERYSEGRYYPICIGEILVNQYRVEHKLGHGGFSTVWMAYDMVEKRDVALKIMSPKPPDKDEYTRQKEIIKAVKDNSHLLLFQDTFRLPGCIDIHRVLVLPLQGPNLRDYRFQAPDPANPRPVRPMSTQMSTARQLLQAIRNLHEGGIVHTDISTANILYSLKPFEDNSVAAKYRRIGRPKKNPSGLYVETI